MEKTVVGDTTAGIPRSPHFKGNRISIFLTLQMWSEFNFGPIYPLLYMKLKSDLKLSSKKLPVVQRSGT
jgi:hypothetical protein